MYGYIDDVEEWLGVNIYTGHHDLLGTIHESIEIVGIDSLLLNNTICMFNFWGEVGELTLVAGCFNARLSGRRSA